MHRFLTAALVTAVAGGGAVAVPSVAAAAAPTSAALNAGGRAVTASGVAYAADSHVFGGRSRTASPVSGTTDSVLYSTVRVGVDGYSIPLADGEYSVTLKLVENYWNAAGKRVFDVSAEGRRVLSDVDPFAAAGGKNRAVDRTFTATVTDGDLDLRFDAERDQASVAAVLVVPTSGGPAPAPAPAVDPSTQPVVARKSHGWSAPTLVDPVVWRPSASHRSFSAPADRDVRIEWPSTPLDVEGGFEFRGGRNVVSIGGTVKFSKRYFPSMVNQPNDNRCLKITGNSSAGAPRTVHFEDFHCAGSHVWEGINIDSQRERGNLTVQLRDIRIDSVNVEHSGGRHIGGDALQAWNGPHRLRIDGFTAKNLEYQGFYLQPYQFGSGRLGAWEIRDVNLEGASSGSAYLLWLAGSRSGGSGGVDMTVSDVYVQPGGGRTGSNSVRDAGSDWPEVVIGRPAADFVR